MRIIGTYKITNNVNGRFYIGSSVNIHSRWSRHRCDFRDGKHENPYMLNDYIKCGIDAFEYSIIAQSPDEATSLLDEQALIDASFDNQQQCYNINEIASKPPSPLGRVMKQETKDKIGASRSGEKHWNWGKKLSDDHAAKLKASRLGKKNSPEAIAKTKAFLLSDKNPARGKELSPEHAAKLKAGRLGKKNSPEHMAKIIGQKRTPAQCDNIAAGQLVRSAKRFEEGLNSLMNLYLSITK